MAWPFTPIVTAIDNSLPYMPASLFNQLQAYIGHIFGGTKTLKSVNVDGTGDAASAITAGLMRSLYLSLIPAAGDATTIATVTAAVTNLRLLFDVQIGTTPIRFYVSSTGALYITSNAAWNAGAADWVSDNAGLGSAAMTVHRISWKVKYRAPGAAHWVEGAWIDQAVIDCATGAMEVLGTFTGGTGVTATTGNVQASAGNLVGRRFRSIGTALNAAGTDFSTTGFDSGGAGYTKSVFGTDAAFRITITCGAGGGGAGPTFTLTFKDGVFANAIGFGALVDSDHAGWPVLTATKANLLGGDVAMTWTCSGITPAAGKFYRFECFVIAAA